MGGRETDDIDQARWRERESGRDTERVLASLLFPSSSSSSLTLVLPLVFPPLVCLRIGTRTAVAPTLGERVTVETAVRERREFQRQERL